MKYERILLVDDDEDTNFVNQWLIKKELQATVVTKNSVDSALIYLNEINNNAGLFPDLILLDIQMPISDGFDFLRKYDKLDPAITQFSKIVMLSSSFDKSDYDKALKNNYVKGFLNKPLNMDELKCLFQDNYNF